MSTPSHKIHIEQKIIDFYTTHLKEFGNSSQGMGWKDDQAQWIRFAQLSKVIAEKRNFSINDLGCGAGRFYKYLQTEDYVPSIYYGYDILDEMIQLSKKNLSTDAGIILKKIQSAEDMSRADYTIASGIFNVKYDAEEADWHHHVLKTLEIMNEKSNSGFSFNLLTSYSDKEFMQAYLYYADPLFFFDFCKRNFSKNVALLHDYFQYDFTILVRKG